MLTYTVQTIPITAAPAGGGYRIPYRADFLRVLYAPAAANLTYRIGNATASPIAVNYAATFRGCEPWEEMFLNWTATASETIVILLALGSEAWP